MYEKGVIHFAFLKSATSAFAYSKEIYFIIFKCDFYRNIISAIWP